MNFFAASLHQLLPNSCYLCGSGSREFLCPGCRRDLPLASSSGNCDSCGLPLPEQTLDAPHPKKKAGGRPERGVENRGNSGGILCGDCLRYPKPFHRTMAAFIYGHPIDFLINRFKHHRHFVCGNYLSEYLLPRLHEAYSTGPWPDLLLPMPLHWMRRCTRGFNQSDAIAYQLQKSLGIPISHCCRRVKRNPRQQGLIRQDRLRNLNHAFAVQTSPAEKAIEGRHVALVDDVMTTGATVAEVARCLREAGAIQVDVWVLARVP